ncbi:isochorismate synthase [Chitiniphilus eburneus]|uniref:isochorismate synthase n=1 Tax=Chitiniphilus eburneus TaxID=2571148 RepID=UPI0035D00491
MNDTFTTSTRAADLLRRYTPGSNVFVSPRQTLLTTGCRAVLQGRDMQRLSMAARDMLVADDVLIGTIPFNSDTPTYLVIPEATSRAPGNHGESPPLTQQTGKSSPSAVALAPTPDGYRAAVSAALSRIARHELAKVVLSRSLTVAARIDLPQLLQRLAERNLHGYTFAIDLARSRGEPRTLIGASPELLLAKQDGIISSHPLAGSVPRVPDPVTDKRNAERLLQSAKDLYEHKVVVDAVAEALAPHCSELTVPSGPALVRTSTMWHLGTQIQGLLRNAQASSLELALALHPTPAVCGYPTHIARDFISEVEGFDRGYFTGLTGWMNKQGDGEWAVTIRCAEVGKESATLYAGAGIVAGSDPDLELAETSGKLRTMLAAMELDNALEGWA